VVCLGIDALDKVKNKTEKINKKPVNIFLFAGFFIVIGMLLLGFGFYYIGKIEVAEGVVHDQMGHALVQKTKTTCDSDFRIDKNIKTKRKQQRQVFAMEMAFPQLLTNASVNIQLCDDSEIKISDNFAAFQIMLKHNGNYYLFSNDTKNPSNSSLNLGQIKHVISNQ
jgi:hypothetical protein